MGRRPWRDDVTEKYPDARTPRPAPWPFAYPPWMDQGLCAQADPEAFFPDKGGSTREAKAICARCPVAAECLDHALEHQERFGIWGGLSERERRRINLDTSQEPA